MMQHFHSITQSTEINGQAQLKLSNFRMFGNKFKEEWGWDIKDSRVEWDRLVSNTRPDKIYKKPTLPGRQEEPWIYIHWADFLNAVQGLQQGRTVQLAEKPKKFHWRAICWLRRARSRALPLISPMPPSKTCLRHQLLLMPSST